jgi:predicted nuclease of predicted toxin-antitoxin system
LGQPSKIIWLKVKNQSRSEILKILMDHLMTIEGGLLAKDWACVELTQTH